MQDEYYMARALKLAQRGRFTTHPNPNVGCVIVKDGEIVGEGYHQRAGDLGRDLCDPFLLQRLLDQDQMGHISSCDLII